MNPVTHVVRLRYLVPVAICFVCMLALTSSPVQAEQNVDLLKASDPDETCETIVRGTMINVPWLQNPVVIDGKQSSDSEWTDALCIDVQFKEKDGDKTFSHRWWFKNDKNWLYMLARVPKSVFPDYGQASIGYFWPYPWEGFWENADWSGVGKDIVFDAYGWDEANWYLDTEAKPPGTLDAEGDVSEDPQYYWYEFRKRLNSNDVDHDWPMKPGDTFGTDLTGNLSIGHWDWTTSTFYRHKAMMHLSSLEYVGPVSLPADEGHDTFLIGEDDHKITHGDYVHVRLPFKNSGNTALKNLKMQVSGVLEDGQKVLVLQDKEFKESGNVFLQPASIGPGQVGQADFWFYVPVPSEPSDLKLNQLGMLRLVADSTEWIVPFRVEPIKFDIAGDDEELDKFTHQTCLHTPESPDIQRYANFAAAERSSSSGPSQAPDSARGSIKNMLATISDDKEFDYSLTEWDYRPNDTDLLKQRGGDIGLCTHYADLTIGLMRAIGIPARWVTGTFNRPSKDGGPAYHSWVEINLMDDNGWIHIDPRTGWFDSPLLYQSEWGKPKYVYADKYPMTTASMSIAKGFRCVKPCYNIDQCDLCKTQSDNIWQEFLPDLSCVDKTVKSKYLWDLATKLDHKSSEQSTNGNLISLDIQSPISIEYMIPFTVTTVLKNTTDNVLNSITIVIADKEYARSPDSTFFITPSYQDIPLLKVNDVVTHEWQVALTQPIARTTIHAAAYNEGVYASSERPLTVNMPGTKPDLFLSIACNPSVVVPGTVVTFTAGILDNYLEPLVDPQTDMKIILREYPSDKQVLSQSLTYCESCEAYTVSLALPDNLPVGSYEAEIVAKHPNFETERQKISLYARDPIRLEAFLNAAVFGVNDIVEIEAKTYVGNTEVKDNSAWAEVETTLGKVSLPMYRRNDGTLAARFRPVDLESSLGGQVPTGDLLLRVVYDNEGSEIIKELQAEIIHYKLFLPQLER